MDVVAGLAAPEDGANSRYLEIISDISRSYQQMSRDNSLLLIGVVAGLAPPEDGSDSRYLEIISADVSR